MPERTFLIAVFIATALGIFGLTPTVTSVIGVIAHAAALPQVLPRRVTALAPLLVLVALAAPAVARAQESAPDSLTLARLRVRLALSDSARISWNDTTLVVMAPRLAGSDLTFAAAGPDPATTAIPVQSIDRIELPRTMLARGALMGVLLGGLAAALFFEVPHDCDNAGGCGRTTAAGVLLVTTTGAVGAYVGNRFPAWATVLEQ